MPADRWDLLVRALAAKPSAKRGWLALAQDWAMDEQSRDAKPAQDANDCWASMAKDWAAYKPDADK